MKTFLIGMSACLLLASSSLSVWAQNTNGALAIVVNKENPLNEISSADLRKIFLGQRSHWDQGRAITVVMRDTGQNERETILQRICQMTESEFTRYFLQAIFTGQVQTSPKRFTTAAGVRQFVTVAPGAIGYLRVNDVGNSVKVLRINGRLPSDTGYELVTKTR